MTDTTDKLIIQAESLGFQLTNEQIEKLRSGLSGVAVDSEKTEKSTTSLDRKFGALERTFATTSGSALQYAKVQDAVNKAVAQNPDLQGRAGEILEGAASRYLGAADAVKKLGTAHEGLSAQGQAALHSIRSFGEQIALGIPPTQALTGQLNHLTFAASGEGGLAGAFGQVGSLIGRFVTPLTATVGIVGGAAAAVLYLGNSWQKASGEVDRALTGIGERTGTTTADIANFTKANASATGLSVSQARDVALEFTKTGNVAISGLKGVGDAIQGYALLTGKDASEATKTFASALSGDLVKGLQEIDQRYGALDSSTTEYIRTLADQGNKTQALQVYINAIAPANQRAEASVTSLSKAWQGFKNVISNIGTAPVVNTPQDTLNNATSRRDEAVANQSNIGRNAQGELVQFDSYAAKVKAFEEEVAKAQKAATEFTAGNIPAALRSISTAGDEVVRSIIPQIDQIDKLQAELNKLNDARNTPGVNRSLGQDDAAATAIQNQIAGLREAQGQAERYNQRVADISTQWGDVGQSTALALQAAQNQLPVIEAVGGAAKMSAQYGADYANAMDQGKTATEAAALAASNLAAAQAQVTAAAKEQLFTLQNEAQVAAARNPQEAILAQGQATYNSLVHQGVDEITAEAVATQQVENARTQVYNAVQRSVKASQDNLDLVSAQGTGTEALVKSQIAYDNAIQSGATSAQAAIISVNTLQSATIQAAQAAQSLADAWERAQRAARDAQYVDSGDPLGYFQTKSGVEGNSASTVPFWIQQTLQNAPSQSSATARVNSVLSSGGVDAAISAAQGLHAGTTTSDPGIMAEVALGMYPGQLGLTQTSTVSESEIIGLVQQLYQAKNSQTTDKGQQASNLQQELAWLQSQPQTIETLNAIASLRSSIESLTNSTDNLNSTNRDLLSPYYSQDPRTSHIGFRSQGMATGGELTVPGGYSANDNMLAQIPVASGEIVSVRRPGQELGGSNTINLGGVHITITGNASKADANAIGRTAYQGLQSLLRQQQAASR